MVGRGLSFDYEHDAWAIELGFQLGHLEFFFGNRNFEGSELGDQIRQREQDWTRAVNNLLRTRGLVPLDDHYEQFGDLAGGVFMRLGDERLKALALIGMTASRLTMASESADDRNVELIRSARGLLGQVSPYHVTDPDGLLAALMAAHVQTPADAAKVVAEFEGGDEAREPLAFDYDRDLWAIDLGAALGGLEFAFRNRNFDGTELGEQVRAGEQQLTAKLDAALTARGLGHLRGDYHDFGEMASDVLLRLDSERIKALALIGVCVSRLGVAFGVQGDSRQQMMTHARESLNGVGTFHIPERDELFAALVSGRADTAAKAGLVLASSFGSPNPPPARAAADRRGAQAPPADAPTVFLSYAHKDFDAARRLVDELRAAGVAVWFDKDNLKGGQRWRPAISDAIENSQYFVALLSSQSVSHRGQVQEELSEALEVLRRVPESETFLIPVRLDDAKPTNRELRQLHWVDLFPDWRHGFELLLAAVAPGSDDAVSSLVLRMTPEILNTRLSLGWQLGRYEIIQGSEFEEARAAEPQVRDEIEGLLRALDIDCSLEGLSARQAIRDVLIRTQSRDTREHGAILIGFAAFRVQLIGNVSDAAREEEVRQLAFSALLDIDPSVVPNKHALFDELIRHRPATTAALSELLQGYVPTAPSG